MGTLQIVQNLIVEQFDLKLEELAPEAHLDSIGLDSLSIAEFTFILEDKLNIQIPDERVELKTIADVTNLIDKVLNGQNSLAS
jgi:acyl carrier protein